MKPPAEYGFSGTAKMHAIEQAPLIKALMDRGYTKVEQHDRH